MGNYSNVSSCVRVDFFKLSGKYYTTEAVNWMGRYKEEELIYEQFADSVIRHLRESTPEHNVPNIRLSDMVAVCLDPFHPHSHPLMMKVEDMPKLIEDRDERNNRKAEDQHQDNLAEEGYRNSQAFASTRSADGRFPI